MEQQRKFCHERLENIRRMRKARRLFKQQPLFALYILQQQIPDYDTVRFIDDLRRQQTFEKAAPLNPVPLWQVQ